jgi:hypothetical protein
MCLKPTIAFPEPKKMIRKGLRPSCIENRHHLVAKMMYVFETGEQAVKTWKKSGKKLSISIVFYTECKTNGI